MRFGSRTIFGDLDTGGNIQVDSTIKGELDSRLATIDEEGTFR